MTLNSGVIWLILKDIKYKFHDKELFQQALTHSSWINENPNIREDNQRLEFIGDSVLGLMVAHCLFINKQDWNEDALTLMKAEIVKDSNLAIIAEEIGVNEAILLGKGEESNEGRKNPSILAQSVEALIGAIWIDQGLKETQKFIEDHIIRDISSITDIPEPKQNTKNLLQEYCQEEYQILPDYQIINEEGPAHSKTFTVEVYIHGKPYGKGIGKSRKEAEFMASAEALRTLSQQTS